MFTLHRAERADTLADALATALSVPLVDPMATEIVAVPAKGVERWLAQHLSSTLGASAGAADGISANVDFASPTRIVARIVEGLSKDVQASERWRADRMIWPVLATLDEHIDDPRLAVLAHHVGRDDSTGSRLRRGRRLSTARTIANLFDSYGWQRPTMLADWAADRNTDATTPLPESLTWQPWFWRLVRERIGVPHIAEELDTITSHLRETPSLVDLPARLSIFGPTRIPETMREVLSALAVHRDVHLYLPHPSDALWQMVDATSARDSNQRAAATKLDLTNPLLASLSRDVVELQECVGPYADTSVYHPAADAGEPSTTLLQHLQASLRHNSAGPIAGSVPDSSLELHACHGAERQVEVLRDRLLRLFVDDPTLQPRDVLIMCPDVEEYAPLIRGAFGQTGLDHPAFTLRVRLADRGLRQTNDVLNAVASLLELAAGRARVGDLVDFAGQTPVRTRFGFSDDDLDTLANWCTRANIRWGVDVTQRLRFGLGGFPQGTAQTGLDRIVLGVVADESEDEWLATSLPLAGVDSTATDLVGRIAEFFDRIGSLLSTLAAPRRASGWAEVLRAAIDQLTATEPDTEWQRAQAVSLITEALDLPVGIDPTDLELNDVRDLMTGLLAARPTRANFRTGELTVCSMVPMRSVPHRAIILLGLDDGAFPRIRGVDGDDILAVVPFVGERDIRNEDRQVFLDALTAARDHLIVFYSGADAVSGVEVPPAVVVSELIDAAHTILDVGPGQVSPIVTRHTLHAFEHSNFVTDDAPGGLQSFDSTLLPGARALAGLTTGDAAATEPALLRAATLPAAGSGDIELDEFIRFLVNPLEGFVRQRLGASLPEGLDGHADQLDIDLDGLQAWAIGDRLLAALLDGDDLGVAQKAEMRRGTLPPFTFGTVAMRPIVDRADAVFRAAQPWRSGTAAAIDVRFELPDGRRMYGTIGDIFTDSSGTSRLCTVTYSRVSSKQRLQTWIKLLALAANASHAPVQVAAVVGRGSGRGTRTAAHRFTAPSDAADLLTMLVAFYDAARRQPIALPLSAANAAAEDFDKKGNHAMAMRRASYAFSNAFDADDYQGYVFRGEPGVPVSFDELARAMPDLHDVLARWLPGRGDTPTFIRVASAVFGPLQQNEVSR